MIIGGLTFISLFKDRSFFMYLELYYEHYAEPDFHERWKDEKKALPYLIKFSTVEERNEFKQILVKEGFTNVGGGDGANTLGLLVNMGFRKFANMSKPVNQACVDGKAYSPK